MADLNALSEKEKALYDLIKKSEVRVTNKVIIEKLSEKHIGALGKLVSKGLVEKTKTQKERDGYGKLIKYYRIKKDEEKKMTIKEIAKKLSKPEKEFSYRMDGRIEWYCKHGIGHTVWSPHKDKYAFVHGCDGCCTQLKKLGGDK